MTLDFFYNNYKLEDINIERIFIKDNKLHLCFSQVAYLELIANGYRPEMNVDYDNEFIFICNHKDKKYNKNSLKKIDYNNELLFTLDDEIIEITDNNIEISAI